MLRLAARFADLYDTDFQLDPRPVVDRIAALEAACAEVGRDPAQIGRTAGFRLALAPPGGDGAQTVEYEVEGVRWSVRRAPPDVIVTILRGFEAAGVRQVTCAIVDPPGLPGIERFAPVIEAVAGAASS
jgi:hypothetical protein